MLSAVVCWACTAVQSVWMAGWLGVLHVLNVNSFVTVLVTHTESDTYVVPYIRRKYFRTRI